MLIKCPHCRSKARIGSSKELTPTISDLYCQCSNIEGCGATFKFTLSFSHYLNPPIASTQQLAASLIRHLPKDQRRELLAQADLFG